MGIATVYWKGNNEEKDLSPEKSYRRLYVCENCHSEILIVAPKGLEIKYFLNSYKGICPNCECPLKTEYRR